MDTVVHPHGSMIFRSFALIVLAAVAPGALMPLPWENTKAWSRLWCETVIALLIAKPLAATLLAVAVKLFANSTSFSGLAVPRRGNGFGLRSTSDGAQAGSSRLVVKPDQRLRNRFDTRRSIPALFKPLSAMSRTLGDDMELEYSQCILEYAVGEHTGV